MELEKSPGTDGLPSEFYKTMWIEISEPLLNALNYGFETGELSISQRRGIIKLIPKKSEELYYIRNWRPLTLLEGPLYHFAKYIHVKILGLFTHHA